MSRPRRLKTQSVVFITQSNITWNCMQHCNDNVEHEPKFDVIIGAMASEITNLTVVCSTAYSDTDKRTQLSFTSLTFLRGIHRGPLNSPHKGPVTPENVSIWWRHHGHQGRHAMLVTRGLVSYGDISESVLAQAMACCLLLDFTKPLLYRILTVRCPSSESYFTMSALASIL